MNGKGDVNGLLIANRVTSVINALHFAFVGQEGGMNSRFLLNVSRMCLDSRIMTVGLLAGNAH